MVAVTQPALLPDVMVAETFCRVIMGEGDVHEVRIPQTRRDGPRRFYGPQAGWFDDPAAIAHAIQRVSGNDAPGVYLTLNPTHPVLLARTGNRLVERPKATTADANIAGLRNLLIDIDSVRPDAHVSATEAELAAATALRERVRLLLKAEFGAPAPVWIGQSGNGATLVYRLALANTPGHVALVHGVLQGLAAVANEAEAVIDASTYNPSRLVKIAGTIAAKGADMPDRPYRRATGIANPHLPKPIPIEVLCAIAALAPPVESQQTATPGSTPAAPGAVDVADLLRQNQIGYRIKHQPYGTVYQLEQCLTSADHTDGAVIIQFPSGAVAYRCLHNRCAEKRWADVRERLGLGPRDEATPAGGLHRGTTAPGAPPPEPPWPTLDPAAMYGIAGDVVRTIDSHTEADPVATLMTFLVMTGSAIGRTPHLMVGDDRHGLNEFGALVGQTAKARKGSSRSGPLRILAHADPAWARDRVQGGLSSGEGLLAAVADPVYRLNKKGEHECVFEGSEDKRLLCLEEELSQLLKVSGRQGNIISEIVRRAWDSRETMRTMTKASPLTVTGPHISLIGHITADELRRELDDTARANGFGNRFLWFCVRRSKAEPFLAPVPEATVADLGRRLQRALAHARKTTRATLDDEAQAIWREVYPDLSAGKPGLVGALTARAEAHALRLALTYALLDGSTSIRGAHLLAALALIDYVEASARYIFGDATGDPIADRILAALRSTGPMAQNDIMDLFGRHVSSARLGQALETLVTAGRIRATREATGGRSRTIWRAIP